MVCLPWAFTLNGLVHSSYYHGGSVQFVQLLHLPQTFVYFSGHSDKFFALDFFHTEVRGQPVNNSHRSCEGFGPYVVTICVTTGLALELDDAYEQFGIDLMATVRDILRNMPSCFLSLAICFLRRLT